MKIKLSRCMCFQVSNREEAIAYYSDVFGTEVLKSQYGTEFTVGNSRIFIDEGPQLGPILEYYVADLEEAKAHFLEKGCEVLRWDGRGKCCYLRDPFGVVFNLWEAPEEFCE